MSARFTRTHRLLLWAAATDSTFQVEDDALVGKCIHCKKRLAVDRVPRKQLATLEHIVPRHHGGTNALMNLAVACARCNHGKGMRLDHRKAEDPTLQRVIETLKKRRKERFRESPEGLLLPPLPS